MNCRACSSSDLVSVLDLGKQPLANRLLSESELDKPEPLYGLHLLRCVECGLCQLDTVVDPAVMYGPSYPYRSSTSEAWKYHCRDLVHEIQPAGKYVLDIGCLDGVFLDECSLAGGAVTGIDPSNSDHCDSRIVRKLFTKETRLGKYDVIVAQNVIGHVDDARGFLEGIRHNLRPDGVAIIECPWVVPLIQDCKWDTIYHEHLSYWSVGAMNKAATMESLEVSRVKHFPELHGGTVRFYLTFPKPHETVQKAIEIEKQLTPEVYRGFTAKVGLQIRQWEEYFSNPNQKVMAGFGASAKGATFLNTLWVRPPLVGVFDDTPSKQGKYTPGHHFPILRPTEEMMGACEELICLAPNWSTALEARARSLGFTGEVRSLWT